MYIVVMATLVQIHAAAAAPPQEQTEVHAHTSIVFDTGAHISTHIQTPQMEASGGFGPFFDGGTETQPSHLHLTEVVGFTEM